MWRKLAEWLDRVVSKYVPDAFPLAFILLFITIVLARILTGTSFLDISFHMGKGFWTLVGFTTQIVMTLVLGHVVASTPLVGGWLRRFAVSLRSPRATIFATSMVSNALNWVNPAIGMLGSAVLAKEVIANNRRVPAGLVVAAAYAGMVPHALGMSAAMFMSVATPGHPLESAIGVIPISKTALWLPNLLLSVVLSASMAAVFTFMLPPTDDLTIGTVGVTNDLETGGNPTRGAHEETEKTPASVIERSIALSVLSGVVLAIGVIEIFRRGGAITFDSVNLILFSVGLLLHRGMSNFAKALKSAVTPMYGTLMNFPVYGAIMGIMAGTGLAKVIADWFVSFSTSTTLPLYTFWSAGIINIFIPSAGGQWVVQGPVMAPAAVTLGVLPAKIVSAVAIGDTWTNMIQPFWALPILGITGRRIKEIVPYTFAIAVWIGVLVSLWIRFVYPFF
ncbi:MAG: short-chain fatty acid transporter [Firmicutes bacterium]|nr:short-chain fatty acid transporter [Bacillota bacterium]